MGCYLDKADNSSANRTISAELNGERLNRHGVIVSLAKLHKLADTHGRDLVSQVLRELGDNLRTKSVADIGKRQFVAGLVQNLLNLGLSIVRADTVLDKLDNSDTSCAFHVDIFRQNSFGLDNRRPIGSEKGND